MIALIVIIIIQELLTLGYVYLHIYKPMQKLWDAIKIIDFSQDSIDFSKLDVLPVNNKWGIANKLIFKYKELADIICERITKVNEVTDISEHDELSQCYNIQKLNATKWSYEQCMSFIVIFIDVNNLKRMNDTLGHKAGDALIKKAAKAIKFWDKYGDVYRIGGDEFMVVIPNASLIQANQAIWQWHSGVGVLAETKEGFKCMLSIGVAEGHKGESFDSIQKLADDRMYDFKVNLKKQLGEPLR